MAAAVSPRVRIVASDGIPKAAQADVQRPNDAVAGVRTDLHEFDAARAAALGTALCSARGEAQGGTAQVKQLSDDASTALNAVLGRGS